MQGWRLALRAAALWAAGALGAQAAEDLPFVGTWNCEVATFTFTPTTYNNGSEDLAIRDRQEGTDGSYTLFFDDDYTVTLSGFSEDAMGWFSPSSGDSFQCTRTGEE